MSKIIDGIFGNINKKHYFCSSLLKLRHSFLNGYGRLRTAFLRFFNYHNGIPDLFIISIYARSSFSLNITMLRGLRSHSSARSMNALAASPCNVGIIFTGVAMLLLPFDSRCKISQNSLKLQGIGKISTKERENRSYLSRNLFKLT